MTFPPVLLLGSRRYVPEQARYRVVWDDECPDWNYKCRTQDPGFVGPDNPPAVFRFAPEILPAGQQIGDYRVNLQSPYDWKPAIIAMNDGDIHKWEYMVDPSRAQYNDKGWPYMQYLVMSGNEVRGERIGDWFKFVTLKQADVDRVAGWTIQSHPWLIHSFHCVTWDREEQITKYIWSTGTNRGSVYYPLISREGYGWIPARFVKEL